MKKPLKLSEALKPFVQAVEPATEASGGQVPQSQNLEPFLDQSISSPEAMNNSSIRSKLTESENVFGSSLSHDAPNGEERYE